MSLRSFLVELASSGRVRVSRQLLAQPPSPTDVGPILTDLDLAARAVCRSRARAPRRRAPRRPRGARVRARRDRRSPVARAGDARGRPGPKRGDPMSTLSLAEPLAVGRRLVTDVLEPLKATFVG